MNPSFHDGHRIEAIDGDDQLKRINQSISPFFKTNESGGGGGEGIEEEAENAIKINPVIHFPSSSSSFN